MSLHVDIRTEHAVQSHQLCSHSLCLCYGGMIAHLQLIVTFLFAFNLRLLTLGRELLVWSLILA